MAQRSGERFMEETKYNSLSMSDQMKGLAPPPVELPAATGQPVLTLPDPHTLHVDSVSITSAIEQRRSVREYARTPLTLQEVSFLLWCTQGVSHRLGHEVTMRTVPSAGARHAFETYVLINNVKDIEQGLYRFHAHTHQLLTMSVDSALRKQLRRACFDQEMVATSAVAFVWTAVIRRMSWRYGERGYRYVHLDAGHVCQNLYLAAEAIGCGVCAIAAFNDDEVNHILGIDGKEQFAVYIGTAGKKK